MTIEVFDPFEYLSQKFDGFLLRHFSFRFQVPIKIVIAYFSHNVHVVSSLKNIVQFNDVSMANFLHNFDLAMQIFEVEGTGENSFVDNLDCNGFASGYNFASVD